MSCCGNRTPTDGANMTRSTNWNQSGGVRVEYLAHPPIFLHGPSSGRRYEFPAIHSVQIVDPADAAQLLRTPYFRVLAGV